MSPRLVDRTIQSYKFNETKADDENEREDRIIIRLPYVPGFSLKFRRELKREVGVDVIFKRGVTIRDHICKLKPPKTDMEKKGAIYHIPCKDCEKPYVGETKVRLKKRLGQHKGSCKAMDMKNGPAHHMWELNHQIDWESTSIIDQEKQYSQRKIKEALYINAMNPGRDVTSLMNIEKGDYIDPCWNEFLPEIKDRVLRRRTNREQKK